MTSISAPVQSVLDKLKDIKPQGGGWQAKCPAHDDNQASLSINQGDDGRALLRCHAGCGIDQICSALEIQKSALFAQKKQEQRKKKRRIIAIYPYVDEQGKLLYQAIRTEPKGFFQRIPNGSGGWEYKLNGVRRVPYRLPGLLASAGQPVYIPEGEKDVETLVTLGLTATCNVGGAGKWLDPYADFLAGRMVTILPDNDEPGRKHALQVARSLVGKAKEIRIVQLPDLPAKGDVTDWINRGGTKEQLLELAENTPLYDPATDQPEEPDTSPRGPYSTDNSGTWMHKGDSKVQLANFTAEIIAVNTLDDGAEQSRVFEIKAVRNQTIEKRVEVTASDYQKMGWVLELLGPAYIVNAGGSVKDHMRAAIQELSKHIEEHLVFTHTGWRPVGGKAIYLTGHGCIGGGSSIQVSLPGLPGYQIQKTDNLQAAITSAIDFIDAADTCITIPLLAACFRSVLGGTDFFLHLVGPTGCGKSTLTALIQQFFGRTMGYSRPPANWSSTANSLEMLAFLVKDAVLVIDDYKPAGSRNDQALLKAKAERLLRNVGNGAGRQRLSINSDLRPVKAPRCLPISTGEDHLPGESIRARGLCLEVRPEDFNWAMITSCQKAAAAGLYEGVMFAYLEWLQPQIAAIQQALDTTVHEHRVRVIDQSPHKRTATIIANLFVGLQYFYDFLESTGFVNRDLKARMLDDAWRILLQCGVDQDNIQRAANPADRFIDLLRSGLASGACHIAAPDGSEPSNPSSLGWKRQPGNFGHTWSPSGTLTGWEIDGVYYLDPNIAYQVVRKIDADEFPVTPRTLNKRLAEKGYILQDETRQTYAWRKRIGGRSLNLICLSDSILGYSDGEADDQA
jgi:energy-coupling factor transporter ATP-binding protein EcfA2